MYCLELSFCGLEAKHLGLQPVDQLDCNCHLPCTQLGSGQLCAYNGGSRATQEAANIVVPDRFYNIDAISCQDQSTAGNQVRNTVEVGTRSF